MKVKELIEDLRGQNAAAEVLSIGVGEDSRPINGVSGDEDQVFLYSPGEREEAPMAVLLAPVGTAEPLTPQEIETVALLISEYKDRVWDDTTGTHPEDVDTRMSVLERCDTILHKLGVDPEVE